MFQLKGLFGLFGLGNSDFGNNGQQQKAGLQSKTKDNSFWKLIQSWTGKAGKNNQENIAAIDGKKGLQNKNPKSLSADKVPNPQEKILIQNTKLKQISNGQKAEGTEAEKEISKAEKDNQSGAIFSQTPRDWEGKLKLKMKKGQQELPHKPIKKNVGFKGLSQPEIGLEEQARAPHNKSRKTLELNSILKSKKPNLFPLEEPQKSMALNKGLGPNLAGDKTSVVRDQFAIKRLMRESAKVTHHTKESLGEPKQKNHFSEPSGKQKSKPDLAQENPKAPSTKNEQGVHARSIADKVNIKNVVTEWGSKPTQASKKPKDVKAFQFEKVESKTKGHVNFDKTTDAKTAKDVTQENPLAQKPLKANASLTIQNLVKPEPTLEPNLQANELIADDISLVTPAEGSKAPTEVKPTQSVRTFPFSQQLEQAMFEAIRVTPKSITIRLEPDQLGEMTVKVAVNNDRIQAQIHCENEQVASLIQDSKPDLEQSLKDRGFQQFQCDVKQEQKRRFRQQPQITHAKIRGEASTNRPSNTHLTQTNFGSQNPVDLVI